MLFTVHPELGVAVSKTDSRRQERNDSAAVILFLSKLTRSQGYRLPIPNPHTDLGIWEGGGERGGVTP